MRVTSKTVLEHTHSAPPFTGPGRLTPGHTGRPRPPMGAQGKPNNRPARTGGAAETRMARAIDTPSREQEIRAAAGVPLTGPLTAAQVEACFCAVRYEG